MLLSTLIPHDVLANILPHRSHFSCPILICFTNSTSDNAASCQQQPLLIMQMNRDHFTRVFCPTARCGTTAEPLHPGSGSSSGICKLPQTKGFQSMKSDLDQCFPARTQICQNVQMRQAADFKS